MNKNIIIMGLLIILVGGGAFFGGMQYQKSKTPSFGNFRNGQGMVAGARGTGQRNGTGQNFRPVSGDILSLDTNGITVKLVDGSSKIVLFSDSTAFVKTTSGTKDELKVGDKVMVVGSQNSDGSVSAQNVQINPPQREIPNGVPTKSQ